MSKYEVRKKVTGLSLFTPISQIRQISQKTMTIMIILVASGLHALAATPSAEPPVQKKNSGKTSGKSREHKKGKTRREKDAEGTKAQNRFEPEINAKSPYKFGGHDLEIDTD